MPKFFVADNQIIKQQINIIGEDVNHIKNVLRKKINDEIIICNKDTGIDYISTINKIEDTKIICEIQKEIASQVESNIKVSIYQGLPKSDKMEWIIQKGVELGVYDITPIEMKRCVVKLKDKDKEKKQQRWQKIAEVAAKQCGRNSIPSINPIVSYKSICQLFERYDIVLVTYEKEQNNTLKKVLNQLKQHTKESLHIAVIIGPEGGIAEEEIALFEKHNAKIITLGKRILRTETVALHMLSILMYELENGEEI